MQSPTWTSHPILIALRSGLANLGSIAPSCTLISLPERRDYLEFSRVHHCSLHLSTEGLSTNYDSLDYFVCVTKGIRAIPQSLFNSVAWKMQSVSMVFLGQTHPDLKPAWNPVQSHRRRIEERRKAEVTSTLVRRFRGEMTYGNLPNPVPAQKLLCAV